MIIQAVFCARAGRTSSSSAGAVCVCLFVCCDEDLLLCDLNLCHVCPHCVHPAAAENVAMGTRGCCSNFTQEGGELALARDIVFSLDQ